MSIETLLSRLDDVKRSRKNAWMARCPAHNGDGRSLAVTLGDNGTILLHCFAYQCDFADILAAVGMDVRDLFPDGGRFEARPQKHGVSSFDVLRAMRQEMLIVHFLAEDMAAGKADTELCGRAQLAADRVRKALDLCDG